MASIAVGRATSGVWIMVAASAVATALALYNYLARGTGIDHTPGALLVVVSSVLILLGSLVVALFSSTPRWLRVVLAVLLLLGVLGTGLAAYFLEAEVLLGLMVMSLIGWLIHLVGRSRRVQPGPNAA